MQSIPSRIRRHDMVLEVGSDNVRNGAYKGPDLVFCSGFILLSGKPNLTPLCSSLSSLFQL